MTGIYEIQNSSVATQKPKQTVYYNSEKHTYLLMSKEGVWMVGQFLRFLPSVYVNVFLNTYICSPFNGLLVILDNVR